MKAREPDPRKEPLGVLLVCSQSTAAALAVVPRLDTVALLERAYIVERRCQARSAVLDALINRLHEVTGVARTGPDRDGTDSRPSGTSKRRAKKVGRGVLPSRKQGRATP